MKLVFVVSLVFCYVAAEDFHDRYDHDKAVQRMMNKFEGVMRDKTDVGFVMDASKSAGAAAFSKQAQAAKKCSEALDKLHGLGDQKSKVAVVQYSTNDETTVEIELNKKHNIDKLKEKINEIVPKLGNDRAIGSGLEAAKDHLSLESEPKTKRKVVWLTATGSTAAESANLDIQVMELKNMGVIVCIFLIGEAEDHVGKMMNELTGCPYNCFDKFPTAEKYRDVVKEAMDKLVKEAHEE